MYRLRKAREIFQSILVVSVIILLTGCSGKPGLEPSDTGRLPAIEPDYTDVTIPPNIAPMNFRIEEEGDCFWLTATSESGAFSIDVRSSDGVIKFPRNHGKILPGFLPEAGSE